MSAGKMVIILLAFVGIVAFAHVRTRSAHDVTAKELVGEWRTIAVVNATSDHDSLECDKRTIKEGDGKSDIVVTGDIKYNGTSYPYVGNGKLSHSIIKLKFSPYDINSTFHVESFNNGNEMIWQDKEKGKHHLLLSRNSTASSQAKEKFEKIAKSDNIEVYYVRNDNCS